MAKLVETFCLKMLQEAGVEFLFALTEEYQIAVDAANREDKNHLVKVLLRHLASEVIEQSADKGAAIFLKLYNELGEELKTLALGATAGGVKKEPSTMPELEGDRDVGEVETRSFRKLTRFKINGTIGDPGQKGCIPFSSLCYQIKQGESQGYKIQEIYDGVIRAIEADNPLRDVLELEAEDFDKKEFMKALRSHFMEGDPREMLNSLRIALQGPKETAYKFCCRCVALKKKVIKMYQAEETSFDMENVTTTFYRTIYTGLRQTNIKNELRQVLKDKLLSDGDLLKEVADAQGNEEERLRKFGENENKRVNVSHITCDSDSDETANSSDSSSFGGHSSGSPANKPLSKRQQRKASKLAAKNAPKKQQGDQQMSQQNSKNSQNSLDTSGVEVSKLTAAIEKLTSSNEKLSAEVSVLKTKVEGREPPNSHTPKPPPFAPRPQSNNVNNNIPANRGPPLANNRPNPSAPPFAAPSAGFSPAVGYTNSRRPIYLCPNCIQNNSSWCRHCFICGSDQHKVRDCPEN